MIKMKDNINFYTIIILILGIFLMSGCEPTKTDTQTNVQAQDENVKEVVEKTQEQTKSYKKIATFTGKGNQDTESFRINSDKVKITAKVESSIVRSSSYFQLQSESGEDLLNLKLSVKSLNIYPEAGEEGYGETIIRDLEKGEYYVSVISGINWEVAVYEYS